MRLFVVISLALVVAACGEELTLSTQADPPKVRVDDDEAPAEPDIEPYEPVVAIAQTALEPDRLGPPYPVVLVHGFSGWSDAGPLEYFFDVLGFLAELGEHDVYAPALPPYNSSDERALVLADFIDDVLWQTGRAKVHLIAHSQGGVDARRAMVGLGYADKIASLTTVATPHYGTPLADDAGLLPDGALNPAGQMLGWLIGSLDSPPNDTEWDEGEGSDDPFDPDMAAAAAILSSEGMAAFNEAHPDPAGVPIFSVAAYSNLLPAPDLCDGAVWETPNRVDAVDPLLVGSGLLLGGLSFRPNDGIVPTDSMVWGTLLACVPADHFDEIGQIADLVPGLLSGFDHKELYARLVEHARSLEATATP